MLKLFSGNAASSTHALLAAAVVCLLSAGVHAAPRPLPTPFERYQTWVEPPVIDWRAANARVGEIGGWRAYARGSAEAEGEVDDANKSTPHPTPHGDDHE